MDPLSIIALTTALLSVLNQIGGSALNRTVETLVEAGADAAHARDELREALEKALAEVAADPALYAQWYSAFPKFHDNPALARRVAQATVGMVEPEAERVQPELLEALSLPTAQRAALAEFLFRLRGGLSGASRYKDRIAYANSLDVQGLLRERLWRARRELEIDEALLAHRHLTTDDDSALRGYLAEVRRQLRFMPLPLTRLSGPEARSDAELAQVFVPLTLRDTQPKKGFRQGVYSVMTRRRQEDELPEDEFQEVRSVSLENVFNRYPCFLLSGSPGSGKTTLLRHAALAFLNETSQAELQWHSEPLLPIFLRLRHFGVFLNENRARFPAAAHGALTAFMETYFQQEFRLTLSPGFFDRRLEEGRCLILLDGLDEVSTNREQVARGVAEFVKRYRERGNRFGLASRPKGYESVDVYLRPAAPAIVEVNPLDPEGITQLVHNLLAVLVADPVQRAKDRADLPGRILDVKELARIASTPLFCTALVLVYKYRGAQLPQRRVEVYQEIVDLLLGFWKAQESGMTPTHEMPREDGTGAAYAEAAVALKKRRLAHVAYAMQMHRLPDSPAEFARNELADHIRQQERKDESTAALWAENFLFNSHERGGVFVEAESGTYTFPHQGFREFLAATALKDMRESDFIRTALEHMADDWWEQVILLAGAHPELSQATRGYFVEELLRAGEATETFQARYTPLLLAGQCAVDMAGYLPGPQRAQVERALIHLMRDTDEHNQPRFSAPDILSPKIRLEAGSLLERLEWTPDDLYDFIEIESPLSLKGRRAGGEGQFWIAKYPVTNLQYERFLASDEYNFKLTELCETLTAFDHTQKKTIPMGQQAREWLQANSGADRCPHFWDDAGFGRTRRLCPVVGVTWYEAAAYCVWLTARLRSDDKSVDEVKQLNSLIANPQVFVFRLPSENEWIAAAGGDDNDRYPWEGSPSPRRGGRGVRVSGETIPMYANTAESNLDRTSPVCMYPAGATAEGVMDMVGNVWEWQAKYYDKDENWLSLRGGAWVGGMGVARVATRSGNVPYDVRYYQGFRVVAAPISR